MHWNEPGGFAPDGESLLLSGSAEKDQQGQDQFILNIKTGALKNLNNTPTVWDEHGHFSPDGRKIVWMSSYPYREDKKSNKTLTLKTEFMLMNADGTGQQQLTRFKEPGSPEFHDGIAAGATWSRDGRSLRLNSLVFPDYAFWDLAFEGACGKQ